MSEDDLASADPLLACAIRETKEEVDIAVPMCHLFDRWVTPKWRINASTSHSLLRHRRCWTAHDNGSRCHAVDRPCRSARESSGWTPPHVATDGLILEALASGRVDGQPTAPRCPNFSAAPRWAVGRRARGNQRRACLRSRRARSGRVGRITDGVGVVR